MLIEMFFSSPSILDIISDITILAFDETLAFIVVTELTFGDGCYDTKRRCLEYQYQHSRLDLDEIIL